MTTINLVFINKQSLRTHSVPVTCKSEAQSLVNMLNPKHVASIRISYQWDGAEHIVYTATGKTNQLVKV